MSMVLTQIVILEKGRKKICNDVRKTKVYLNSFWTATYLDMGAGNREYKVYLW